MANYHFHLQIISRSTGRSGVAAAAYTSGSSVKHIRSVVGAAAYRAAEKMEDVTQNLTHDFTRKSGVVYSDILIPENAPETFKDRETLWNAVELKEIRCDARLAREIDLALPREFDRQEQIQIINNYVSDNFVKEGMCADISIHDKGDGNPHAHILLTVRDVDETGFINHDKSRKEWNKTENLIKWRREWAEVCNKKFEEKGLETRIDHRTLEAQGIDRTPTIHLGHEAHKMEKRGIKTERGDINREIVKQNLQRHAQKYRDYSNKISAATTENVEVKRKSYETEQRIKTIGKYKEDIRQIGEKIHNLKLERENAGVFSLKRKKELDWRIDEFTEYDERMRGGFKTRFGVDYDNSDELERQYKRELQALQPDERYIAELTRQRNDNEHEYRRIFDSAKQYYFFDTGDLYNTLDFPHSHYVSPSDLQLETEITKTIERDIFNKGLELTR